MKTHNFIPAALGIYLTPEHLAEKLQPEPSKSRAPIVGNPSFTKTTKRKLIDWSPSERALIRKIQSRP